MASQLMLESKITPKNWYFLSYFAYVLLNIFYFIFVQKMPKNDAFLAEINFFRDIKNLYIIVILLKK